MFKNIKTKNIVRMVYILLFCAVVSSVTYSRYMATTLGSDTANMATFTITSEIVESAKVTIPYNITTDGEIYTYELIITNYDGTKISEVDLDYTVKLEYTDNLPLEITLRETNNTSDGSDTSEDADTSDTYVKGYGYGTVSSTTEGAELYTITDASFPNAEITTHVYYIDVAWKEGASKDYAFSYEIDLITLTITAEQNVEQTSTDNSLIRSRFVTY